VPLALEAEGKIDHIQLKALISGIATFVTRAKIVHPTKRLSVCRDPKDNIILNCCLSAGADILITGDRDLIEITSLPFDLKIITPNEFIKII
jgi:putative PIN family toxin of toxin-antitoxin system